MLLPAAITSNFLVCFPTFHISPIRLLRAYLLFTQRYLGFVLSNTFMFQLLHSPYGVVKGEIETISRSNFTDEIVTDGFICHLRAPSVVAYSWWPHTLSDCSV